MAAVTPAEALRMESLEVAKTAAREWAASLGRKPSKRELLAYITGHLAGQENS